MRAYYRLEGLESGETVRKIYKEIAAVNGVQDLTIDLSRQIMVIHMEDALLPRIEHAAIVILGYITPQIHIQKIYL